MKPTDTIEFGWLQDHHIISEADWLIKARDPRCAEVSETQPP